jgi:hypothetical protein
MNDQNRSNHKLPTKKARRITRITWVLLVRICLFSHPLYLILQISYNFSESRVNADERKEALLALLFFSDIHASYLSGSSSRSMSAVLDIPADSPKEKKFEV